MRPDRITPSRIGYSPHDRKEVASCIRANGDELGRWLISVCNGSEPRWLSDKRTPQHAVNVPLLEYVFAQPCRPERAAPGDRQPSNRWSDVSGIVVTASTGF